MKNHKPWILTENFNNVFRGVHKSGVKKTVATYHPDFMAFSRQYKVL